MLGMSVNALPFSGIKPRWLLQNLIRNCHLADIVQQRGVAHEKDSRAFKLEPLPDRHRGIGDPVRVIVSERRFSIDNGCERLANCVERQVALRQCHCLWLEPHYYSSEVFAFETLP